MKIENLKELKALINLLKSQQVDILEINGLKIVITKHHYAEEKPAKERDLEQDDEDILFYNNTRS